MNSLKAFFKRETTLCIAFAAALVSMLFVPPDSGYLKYIDLRTLALLYCLMAVVAGLRRAQVFSVLGRRLCMGCSGIRALALILVLLCFFSSMLITNDVALITFVPFTLIVLKLVHREALTARIVVLQTVAANLGSMLTPVGNPQNLYLHSHYNMSTGEFFSATAPVWAVSLCAVAVLCLLIPKGGAQLLDSHSESVDTKRLLLHSLLFAVCLLVVIRVMAWYVMLGIILAALLIFDRKILTEPDFFLLLTFVCFFIFSGNLSRVDAVAGFLGRAMAGRELFMGALVSQFISNVPAALVLSPFTDNARALLLGVDIGGLGTPIASLASLISLKIYAASDGADTGRFMKLFLLINFSLLAFLLFFAFIFCKALV